MEWVRGKMIGRGTFGSVYLAVPRNDFCNPTSSLMAVKSSLVSESLSLQKEKEILNEFSDCPQILSCFGEDYTVENGQEFYNLLLEFASRGNLSQLLKNSSGSLPESDVRSYTKSILQGLRFIHNKGYVHCDIKLQNILLCSNQNEVKIADFGLAKKMNSERNCGFGGFRGTPLYMAPESVARDEQEPASDIWALGCVVSEMFTGKPAWRWRPDSDASALLFRIGFGDELPEIPGELCEEGKDFLRKCFVRDPLERWTAEMLLNHPFIANSNVKFAESENASPRSAFDFPEWSSPSSDSSTCSNRWNCNDCSSSSSSSSSSESPADRIRELKTRNQPNWSFTESSWVTVRRTESPVCSSMSEAEKTVYRSNDRDENS